MEFGSTQIIRPGTKKVERGSSKDPKKQPLKETQVQSLSRPQVSSIIKKSSASQDVRQMTQGVRAAGTSLIVKRGASVDKDAAKKKSTKVKKQKQKEEQLEKKRILDEEEKEKLMAEERRRFELERFRKLQADKLTKEERERLILESNIEEEFQLRFQARVYFEERKRNVGIEWANFLSCEEEPNPDSERDQTEYLFRYGEQNEILSVDKAEFYLKKSDYSEQVVVSRLLEACYASQSDNKYDSIPFYEKFISKIRAITTKKLSDLTALLINNQQVFFDEKNAQLEEMEKLPITPDNLRAICGSVQMKPEERYKFEIFKTFESEDNAIALWWSPLERCGYRMKPIEFKRPNVSVEIPRNLNGLPLYMRCLWTRTDYLSQLFSIQKYVIIGGVFSIEAYNMVPLMKRRKKYALKIDFGESEIPGPLKYPPEVQGGLANLPALKISLEIPTGVYIPSDFKPKVAYFSDAKKQWTEEGIEIHKYDSDLRQVHFSTKMLAPLAIVQDVCLDYPYQSFLIRCVEENKAILDLQTRRMRLSFEINGDDVTLLDDENCSVDSSLKSLANEPMNHTKLLQALSRRGVNLIPMQQHANFTSDYASKEVDVENKSLQEFMMVIKTFAVRSSPRNSQAGEEAIVFEIKPNLDYSTKLAPANSKKVNEKRTIRTNDEDAEWIQAAVWCNKCAFLKPNSKSLDTTVADNLLEKSTTHAMISLILSSHPTIVPNSHDIVEKMNDVYCSSFQNNLRRFLKLIRILSFS